MEIVPRYTIEYIPEGYALDVDEYYENAGVISYIDSNENRITFMYGVTSQDICDEIYKLHEEFYVGNPYKGCILTIEEAERVTDIFFYVSDKKQRVVSEKDKKAILLEIMNIKLKDEDKIPENEWIEGGMMVTLALQDGETIEFSCDNNFIAYCGQYSVQNKVASMLMEAESE